MWRLLEAAAKSASANASEYVSSVSEKAQSLVASVQDEAATLLHALGSARTGPVDEILYEEIEDYKAFTDGFEIEARTDEIAHVLRGQENIRDLHEQLVPEHLSYEEFWSRFFFRMHQEEESKRIEEERREKERLELELHAAEHEASGLDLELETHEDAIEGDDLELKEAGSTLDSAAENDPLVQRARDADKRAALAWKKKAEELQKKLGAMAAQLEESKRSITEEKDIAYQNLCDSYEAKMTEVTMQIDDARAVGYDAGIQESEAIIAAMRQAADEEIERLNKQLALREQHGEGEDDAASDWRAEGSESVLQLKEALSLKTQTLASVSAEKVAVETLLVAKDEEIATLSAQVERANQLLSQSARHQSGSDLAVARDTEALAWENSEIKQQLAAARAQIQTLKAQLASPHQASAAGGAEEETRKEIDLWRMRALKMKKLKEAAEAEFQAFKASQHPPQNSDSESPDVNLRSRITELETQCKTLSNSAAETEAKHRAEVETLSQQVAEAAATLVMQKEEAYQRGVVAGKSEMEAQILELQDKVERSYESGFEAATWATQKEIDLLRTEIALLRAGSPEMVDSEAEPDVIWSVPVPVLGDEFSDTDAMSHSIDNLSAVFGGDASASEGEGGGSETWDASASVSDVASDAARDDWGEW